MMTMFPPAGLLSRAQRAMTAFSAACISADERALTRIVQQGGQVGGAGLLTQGLEGRQADDFFARLRRL